MHLKSLRVAVLIAAAGSSVVADELVMRDGSRLETRGPWKVSGQRIILTLPGGTLASIATRDVDLERSHRGLPPAPTSTESRPVEVPRPEPTPVLALTHRDLRPVPSSPDRRTISSYSEPLKTEVRVQVEFWAVFPAGRIEGVEIRGVLRNTGATAARISWIVVEVVEPHGGTRRQKALPHDPQLDVGDSTSFLARFSGLDEDHGDPVFSIILDD